MPLADLSLPPFVRPVRVPEAVTCCTAEPPVARAGEVGRWRLPFVLSEAVPEGQEVRVLLDGGRNVKGYFRPLQVGDPEGAGYLALARESGETIGPLQMVAPGIASFSAPAGGLAAGETLTLDLGGPAGTEPSHLSLPSKMVLLFLPRPAAANVPATNPEAGKGIIGACLIHITGSSLAGLRVHAPSEVEAGRPFEVLVRGEDQYRNVADERPGKLVVRLGGKTLNGWQRRDLPEAACVWLTGVVLEQPGVARLEITDTTHDLKAQANPVRSVPSLDDLPARHYWGMIHGHTEFSDGAGTVDHYFTYMREQGGLDFGALGDHDHVFETSDEMWALAQAATARYNDPGRFVTFLGYEWAKWRKNGDGDRNVYYLHDNRPIYRSDEGHYPTPDDLFRVLADETAMVIPHHSANVGNHCDWKDHDPKKERLVEIFSEWGSSECGVHEGNPYPMRPSPKTPDIPDSGEVAAGFVQRGLALGWRVGFTAGGDDHQAHPGDLTLRGGPQSHTPGLLAVLAKGRTREQIWQALYERHCYGTTGARLIVDFDLAGVPMGSELWLEENPELANRRRLTVAVNGADVIEKIEIVRNNQVVFTHTGATPDESFTWEDTEPFDTVALPPAQYWPTPFCFYYVRIHQADGEMAWISPIWVSPRPPSA